MKTYNTSYNNRVMEKNEKGKAKKYKQRQWSKQAAKLSWDFSKPTKMRTIFENNAKKERSVISF